MINTDKVRIQDDLYTYVNQEKLAQLVIPDDQPSVGGFQRKKRMASFLP